MPPEYLKIFLESKDLDGGAVLGEAEDEVQPGEEIAPPPNPEELAKDPDVKAVLDAAETLRIPA